MTPQEHYQAGQLTEAVAAASAELKKRPADTALRYFLCELLCFAGDRERADDHLDLLVEQDPQAAVGAALFRQLIRGEEWRQQFFREGRVPAFLGQPTPLVQTCLRASIA